MIDVLPSLAWEGVKGMSTTVMEGAKEEHVALFGDHILIFSH